MKLKLSRKASPFLMEAVNEDGHSIVFDAKADIGGSNKGIRPMEGLASSLAACSSIDVIHILRKQRIEPEIYEVQIEAKRRENQVPAVFEKIHLIFKMKGVPQEKAKRAVDLSVEKYCSISKMLETTVEITTTIELID